MKNHKLLIAFLALCLCLLPAGLCSVVGDNGCPSGSAPGHGERQPDLSGFHWHGRSHAHGWLSDFGRRTQEVNRQFWLNLGSPSLILKEMTMSTISEGVLQTAYLRRFFQDTGACQSVWAGITYTPATDTAEAFIAVNLTGQTPVPQEVIDELTEGSQISILWLFPN